MAEKYGKCKVCKGEGIRRWREGSLLLENECLNCDGSGHSKNAMDYYQNEKESEWERWERDQLVMDFDY